jgi:thioredoxin-like negative regulator of GroEL
MPEKATAPEVQPKKSKNVIVLVVIVAFLVLVIAKLATDGNTPAATQSGDADAVGTTITSTPNDAPADYAAAVASGKPIYVLFHSLTCVPCVEISEVADQVIPEYEDEIVFVNGLTDDPAGQQLAADFEFQYIPTSFFLAPGGETVVDSFTGAMDADQMRGYLDALIAAQ